jgi:hypothetical protein
VLCTVFLLYCESYWVSLIVMRLVRHVALFLAFLTAPASAADPIMPLDQVERGMQCEGRSVLRGTEISSFDVEILDVIAPGPQGGAAILFRASGPAVAETGLGPGFSGSPIYCADGEGTVRNAGAVAAGVGDYGNDVAIATPIEDILGQPAPAPSHARPATRAERRARPWTLPLTLSGPGFAVRRALVPVAHRHGIQLLSAPATAAQVPTGVDLQPGSAAGAAMSSGRIGISAIGTVAYRDGDRVWAFGHPLDNAGPRALMLEGAFVHTVVGNPNPSGETLGTYKLASPGTLAGTIDFDGNFAISGTLGALPAAIPVEVSGRGPGDASLPTSRTLVADESALNYPAGFASLSLITSIDVTDSAFLALGSGSGRSYGTQCVRIELRERRRPMGFCNRYVGDGRGAGGPQFSMGGDAAIAAAYVEEYDSEPLNVERVRVTFRLEAGLRFATIRSASAPRRVRPGQMIRVRLVVQPPRERRRRVSFRMRVPRTVKPGMRTLRLSGTSADPGEGSLGGILGFALGARTSDHELFLNGGSAPKTIDGLAKTIASLRRFDGIRGTFRKRREQDAEDELVELLLGFEDDTATGRPLYRHPTLRIGGRANLKLRVLKRRG